MRRAGLQTRGTGKPAATGNLESTVILAEFPTDNTFSPMLVSRRNMKKKHFFITLDDDDDVFDDAG